MIQEQRVILKLIGYGEEGSYNNIVAKYHSQGTATTSAASASHPPGAGAEIYFPAGINQGLVAASAVPPVVFSLPW